MRYPTGRFSQTMARRRPSPVSRRVRPRLELLEDRWLPSTLLVTNTSDTGVNGDGSLRGEIAAAQNGDTITFEQGLSGTITLNSTLTLDKNLTITGPGASAITLSGGGLYQVLDVSPGAIDSISGLTISDGKLTGGTDLYTFVAGAGIRNEGTLALTDVTVSGNTVTAESGEAFGGGIYNDYGATLVLTNDTITGNKVSFDSTGNYSSTLYSYYNSAGGGGLYNEGTATLKDTVVSGNTLTANMSGTTTDPYSGLSYSYLYAEGGGIYNDGGTLSLEGGSVSDNSITSSVTTTSSENESHASYAAGGGLYTYGQVTVQGTSFENNSISADSTVGSSSTTITAFGGGIGSTGSLTASAITVSGNQVNAGTGDLVNGGTGYASGGGIAALYGSALVQDSTISDNTATSNGYSYGGGVSNEAYESSATSVPTMALPQAGNHPSASIPVPSAVSTNTAPYQSDFLTLQSCQVTGNTATGGSSGSSYGGGISNGGVLTVQACLVQDNTANGDGDAQGGGISNDNQLTLTDSTVASNTATAAAGYSSQGGGVYNNNYLTIFNSTVANNQTSSAFVPAPVVGSPNPTISIAIASEGGGIYNGSTLAMVNVTVSGNQALSGTGGGLYNEADETLSMTNVLLAANMDNGNAPDLFVDSTVDIDHSLIGDSTGNNLTNGQYGNLVGGGSNPVIDAKLGSLSNNGGPTPTMALEQGSPAIGAGTTSAEAFTGPYDQRGAGYARVVSGAIDIGAYQTQSGESASPGGTTLVVDKTDDNVSATAGDGTLRGELLVAQNGDTITFANTLSGDTITLADTLTVSTNLTITGPGASTLTLSGGGLYQVLDVSAGAIVTISGLTISDGNAQYGGGVGNEGTLALTNVTLSGNTATSQQPAPDVVTRSIPVPAGLGVAYGGGVYNDWGATLMLTGDTLSGNSATSTDDTGFAYAYGGGLYNAGMAFVQDTTFSQNTASATESGTYTYYEIYGSYSVSQADADGGGLYNSGAVSLMGGSFSGNSATADVTTASATGDYHYSTALGGGLANDGMAMVNGTGFSENTISATTTSGYYSSYSYTEGGGLANDSGLFATGITVSSNQASGNSSDGGGFANNDYATLLDSVISANTAGYGGGVSNYDYLTVVNTQITGNTATDAEGGGIYNSDWLILQACLISDNIASGFSYSDGGGIYNSDQLTVWDSTISGNTAAGAGVENAGGGIYTDDYLTLINSTVGNNVTEGGSGGSSQGAGIYNSYTLALVNVTVAGNQALGNYSGLGQGGGVYNDYYTTVSMTNALLASNTVNDTGPDLVFSTGNAGASISPKDGSEGGTVANIDHTLVGDGTGSGLVNGVSGNLVGGEGNPVIDASLGSLGDNGGPTPTVALLDGSPAIDAGATSAQAFTGPYDQRGVGYDRVLNSTIDIGAFEGVGEQPPLPPSGAVNVASAAGMGIIYGYEYSPLNGVTVATFQLASGSTVPTFSVTIDWGDGTTSVGRVVQSGGTFLVQGDHTYHDEQTYTITVHVSAPGMGTMTMSTSATIYEELLPNGTRGTADQRFISELYRDLLGRSADQAGLDYWTSYYENMKNYLFMMFFGMTYNFNLSGQMAVRWAQTMVAMGFESTPEFQAIPQPTGDSEVVIEYDYQLLMDRTHVPDPYANYYQGLLNMGVSNNMVIALMIGDPSLEYYNKTAS